MVPHRGVGEVGFPRVLPLFVSPILYHTLKKFTSSFSSFFDNNIYLYNELTAGVSARSGCQPFRKKIFPAVQHFAPLHRIYLERGVSAVASYSDEEITAIYNRHVNTVYRICFSFMKNASETEDMVQETFLKLLSSGKKFQSADHEKAWLIVTASNACKDALKHWWRKNETLETCEDLSLDAPFEVDGILSAVMDLPPDYKTVIYLYCYEGYRTPEIAKMLHCPQSTVRSRLARARKLLEKSV